MTARPDPIVYGATVAACSRHLTRAKMLAAGLMPADRDPLVALLGRAQTVLAAALGRVGDSGAGGQA